MATICESVGADVTDLAKAVGLDGRIGRKFLHPGPGYGGSCFPKDTLALLRIAQEHGVAARLVEAGVEVNSAQKARMVKKIRDAIGGSEAGKTIAALGLSFKPETDDIRDAPALSILPPLFEKGAHLRVHDPQGMPEAEKMFPDSIEIPSLEKVGERALDLKFATPQARDFRTGQKSRWENPDRSRNLNDQIGGQLNPNWVEWLMGYQTGHTDLNA